MNFDLPFGVKMHRSFPLPLAKQREICYNDKKVHVPLQDTTTQEAKT